MAAERMSLKPVSRRLKRLALANVVCTASGSDNVSSNLIYLISSSSVSLLLSHFFFNSIFCLGCLSLTCFSLDLFVRHFGSWPAENRALIPQTVDCVPLIKPYLFLCFQSFVLGLGCLGLFLDCFFLFPSSAFAFFCLFVFHFPVILLLWLSQGKTCGDF